MQNLPSSRKRSFQPMSEINMTPFVDVILVLLIIFMVTAPLMQVGVEVELPQTNAEALNEPTEPLVVSIDAQKNVYLQDQKVSLDDLAARLDAISKNNKTVQIFLRADHHLTYGDIMDLMGRVSEGGYEKMSLITDMSPRKKHRSKKSP